MFKYVIIPLATRLTDKHRNVLRKLEETYREHFHPPISSLHELDHDLVENSNLMIFLFLTGGTSRTAVQIDLMYKCPKILLAHREDNSLPSALGFIERKIAQTRYLLQIIDLDRICEEIDRFVKAVQAAYETYNSRIVVLFERKLRDEWYNILAKTNVKIIPVPEVSYRKDSYESFINSLHAEIKEIMEKYRADGVTLDCFRLLKEVGYTPCLAFSKLLSDGIPVACECDVVSLLGFILLRKISIDFVKCSMMVNLCELSNSMALFAHCTVPVTMCEKYELVPHFETGLNYAVKGIVRKDRCTVFRISNDFTRMFIREGSIIETSDTIRGDLCMTRLRVKFDSDVNTNLVLGNHHIITLGEVGHLLRVAAWYLGLEVV